MEKNKSSARASATSMRISPDEVALLEFAQKHGYGFKHGTDELIQVSKTNKQTAYGT